MVLYVFGNVDVPPDDRAFAIAARLKSDFPEVSFQEVVPNADLPFVNQNRVYLLDVILGLHTPTLLASSDLDRLITSSSVTAHDYDLGFQLKYLKKLGKLGEVFIIGLPATGDLDYFLIQSILRKLVEQDIHGS